MNQSVVDLGGARGLSLPRPTTVIREKVKKVYNH